MGEEALHGVEEDILSISPDNNGTFDTSIAGMTMDVSEIIDYLKDHPDTELEYEGAAGTLYFTRGENGEIYDPSTAEITAEQLQDWLEEKADIQYGPGGVELTNVCELDTEEATFGIESITSLFQTAAKGQTQDPATPAPELTTPAPKVTEETYGSPGGMGAQ